MKEEKVGYSHKIGDVDDNPPVHDIEINDFLREYAIDQIKKKKMLKPLLKAFEEVEKNDVRVQHMVCSAKMYNILRKNYRDLLDQNTEKKTLEAGYFGMFWGAMVFVKKDFEGLALFSQDNPEFKEQFPEYSIFTN